MSNELHRLEEEARAGESEATPLIVGAEVWVWTAAAVLVVLALTLLAYRLAS
jgi:hypothetical protein